MTWNDSIIYSLVAIGDVYLASGSSSKIKIWNAMDGTLIRTLNAHSDIINAMVSMENGDLVSGSQDDLVKILEKEF